MPQRTNDFQKIVTLIQEALVPTGAKVIASHMVPGLTPGRFREIDVFIETSIGPYSMKIAVEAKDESRRFDVTGMEEIVGKYKGRNNIVVDRIVVITHRGYSAEAEALARAENIVIMTLDEVEAHDWIKSLGCPVHGLPPWLEIKENQSFKLQLGPHIRFVKFTPSIGTVEEDRAAVTEGRIICRCHGHDKGSLIQHAHMVLFRYVLPNKVLTDKLKETASLARGSSILVASRDVPPNHLLRFRGKDYPITSYSVEIGYVDTVAPMEVKQLALKDDSGKRSFMQYSEAKSQDLTVTMLMPYDKQFERGVVKINYRDKYREPTRTWELREGKWIDVPTEPDAANKDKADPNSQQPPL